MGRGVKTLQLLGIAAAVACVGFIVSYFQLFSWLDGIVTDRLYFEAGVPDERISIIAIDEKSLARHGAFVGWSRGIWAELLHTLGTAPAVVGFDIMFIGEGDIAGDDAFARAAKGKNVVVGAQYVQHKQYFWDRLTKTTEEMALEENHNVPYPALQAVTKQGLVNSQGDADGVVRSGLYALNGMPSFPLAVYKAYCEKTGLSEIPPKWLDAQERLRIPFVGTPGTYPVVSLDEVLSGEIPTTFFQDKIVLVGAYTTAMQDAYRTSAALLEPMHGVEIHANTLQALMEGRGFKMLPAQWYALGTALYAFLAVLLLWYLSLPFHILTAVLTIAAQYGLYLWAVKQTIWLPMVYAPTFVILISLGLLLHRRFFAA